MPASTERADRPPRFACDAMMKGLARWLRGCGYDVTWEYGIDDEVLLAHAREQRRIVLTADGGIVHGPSARAGDPPVVYVPNELPPVEQARAVLGELRLARRTPRCMRCGGAIALVPKEAVAHEAPPRSYDAFAAFFRCGRCGRLLWRGTHWERIAAELDRIAEPPDEPW